MKVVGISLVQNEDRYMELGIRNALPFCDEFIIADNQSKDNSVEIAKRLSKEFDKVKFCMITDPAESQKLIEPYINTDTWIFAVDGDEVYDPKGLMELKEKMLMGECDQYWMIYGNVLHCTDLDLQKQKASGFLARPCRSMTKLYNFSLIKGWEGENSERLHGGKAIFHDEASDEKRLRYDFDSNWEDSIFRCLHLVFLPRSSSDKAKNSARLNIHDKLMQSRKRKILNLILRILHIPYESKTKTDYYRRGSVVEIDISDFNQITN